MTGYSSIDTPEPEGIADDAACDSCPHRFDQHEFGTFESWCEALQPGGAYGAMNSAACLLSQSHAPQPSMPL